MLTRRVSDLVSLHSMAAPEVQSFFSQCCGKMDTWVDFAQALVNLYVPNIPYDPALRQRVDLERYERQMASYTRLSETWERVKSVFLSTRSTLVDDVLLETNPANTELATALLQSDCVYRAETSDAGMFNEWNEMVVANLSKPTEWFISASDQEINTWHNNCAMFIKRMEQRVEADICEIFVGIVKMLQVGVRILRVKSSLNVWWTVDPSFLCWPVAGSSNDISSNLDAMRAASLAKDVQLANGIASYFYEQWMEAETQKQYEAKKEASLYRSQDEDLEQKSMFGDSDEDFPEQTSDKTVDSFNEFVKLYMEMFTQSSSLKRTVITGLKNIGSSENVENGTGDSRPYMGLVFLKETLAENQDGLTNFYHGANLEATQSCISFFVSVKRRIAKLLEEFSDHSTLLNIYAAIDEILAYPASAPVVKYLGKVEQIFTFLNEWNKYAHSGINVTNEIAQCAQIIISWRRLELKCWSELFHHEDVKLHDATYKLWFHLYELLVLPSQAVHSGPASQEELLELVQTLTLFLSQSKVGDFNLRLNMLRNFASDKNEVRAEVRNAVENVVGFYSQFSAANEALLKAEHEHLKKAINEQMLLASWRDTNPTALKESARSSHHKLYKVVRKYRSAISAGVSFVSTKGSSIGKVVGNATWTLSEAVAYDTSSIPKQLVETRPKRLQDSVKTAKIVLQMCPDFRTSIKDGVSNLVELSENALSEADRLRRATPTTFDDETKKVISQLKMEKATAVSELIKTIRETCGFKTSTRADTAQQLALVGNILATSRAPLSEEEFDLQSCNQPFYQILDILPRIRSLVAGGNADVGASLARAFAQSENAVAFLIRLRNTFAKLLGKFSQFSVALKLAENLFRLKKCRSIEASGGFETLDSIISWTPQVANLCIEIASACGEDSSLSWFRHILDGMADISSRWKSSVGYSVKHGVASVESNEISQDIRELLSSGNNEEEASYSGSYFKIWSETVLSKLDAGLLATTKTTNASDEQLNTAVCTLCDSILVCVQELPTLNSEWEDETLVDRFNCLYKMIGALRIDIIGTRLESVIKIANDNFGPLLGSVFPILSAYTGIVHNTLQLMYESYGACSGSILELMRILENLAKDGFCGPQEQNGEDNDESQGQEREGTGMGEGAGSKSEKLNEDDIDEEDMLDQAQRENEEQEDREENGENEEDNAVEIDGDMAGQTEELEEQEQDNQDQDEDKDESKENEIDDEVGDIDELDPNQVDEKMWDEEAKEQKEKEADSAQGQKEEADQGQEQEETTEQQNDNEGDGEQQQDQNETELQEDEEASETESVGEQEDAVHEDKEDEQMDDVAQGDALQLPEDMNLDGDEEEKEGQEDGEEFDEGMEEFDEEEEEEADEEKQGDDDNKMEVDQEGEEEEEQEEKEAEGEGKEDNEPEKEWTEEEAKEDEDEEMQDGEQEPEQQQGLEPEEEAQDSAKADSGGQDENAEDMQATEALGIQDEDQQQDTSAEQQQTATASNENNGADAVDAAATESAQADIDETKDEAREQAREQMRQLGDALKEFYRRHEEIREATNREQPEEDKSEEKASQRPDQFEHVEGQDDSSHQALGAADMSQAIDDELEIDEGDNDKEDDQAKDEDNGEMEVDNEEGKGVQGEADTEQVGTEADAQDETREGAVPGEKREVEALEESEDEQVQEQLSNEDTTETEQLGVSEARELWHKYDVRTQTLAPALCEQLRLILEPTLTSKLSGDYKTGKRLNMKRIIPYIASQFKKDKIWLRRTKPSKRQFQIMISVDDSRSMRESQAVDLAFETIALVAKALTLLESGQLAIARFGEDTRLLHPFAKPFSADSGSQVVQHFTFDQQKTDVQRLLEQSISLFEDARMDSSSGSNSDLWQLQIIISDGVCEDHIALRRLVRKARESRIMLVFVVLDGLNSSSVLDMNQVSFEADASGHPQLKMTKYFDTFPFEYYVIVRDVHELPSILSSVLRQYFEEVSES